MGSRGRGLHSTIVVLGGFFTAGEKECSHAPHGPGAAVQVQKENAAHYLGFLKANEVPTIYENGFHRKKMPFDRKLEKTKADDPILPYTQISAPARALRNANRLWNAVTYRSK